MIYGFDGLRFGLCIWGDKNSAGSDGEGDDSSKEDDDEGSDTPLIAPARTLPDNTTSRVINELPGGNNNVFNVNQTAAPVYPAQPAPAEPVATQPASAVPEAAQPASAVSTANQSVVAQAAANQPIPETPSAALLGHAVKRFRRMMSQGKQGEKRAFNKNMVFAMVLEHMRLDDMLEKIYGEPKNSLPWISKLTACKLRFFAVTVESQKILFFYPFTPYSGACT